MERVSWVIRLDWMKGKEKEIAWNQGMNQGYYYMLRGSVLEWGLRGQSHILSDPEVQAFQESQV